MLCDLLWLCDRYKNTCAENLLSFKDRILCAYIEKSLRNREDFSDRKICENTCELNFFEFYIQPVYRDQSKGTSQQINCTNRVEWRFAKDNRKEIERTGLPVFNKTSRWSRTKNLSFSPNQLVDD